MLLDIYFPSVITCNKQKFPTAPQLTIIPNSKKSSTKWWQGWWISAITLQSSAPHLNFPLGHMQVLEKEWSSCFQFFNDKIWWAPDILNCFHNTKYGWNSWSSCVYFVSAKITDVNQHDSPKVNFLGRFVLN